MISRKKAELQTRIAFKQIQSLMAFQHWSCLFFRVLGCCCGSANSHFDRNALQHDLILKSMLIKKPVLRSLITCQEAQKRTHIHLPIQDHSRTSFISFLPFNDWKNVKLSSDILIVFMMPKMHSILLLCSTTLETKHSFCYFS